MNDYYTLGVPVPSPLQRATENPIGALLGAARAMLQATNHTVNSTGGLVAARLR